MPSMKAIKRRIVSVKNTQQIMKAMNLVAASKLQKNKNRLDRAHLLIEGSRKFLVETPYLEGVEESEYFEKRSVKRVAYVVITGERGLCGGYNNNISKKALEHMNSHENEETIIAIGARCKEYFMRRRKNIRNEYVGVLEDVDYRLAMDIAEDINAMFLNDDVNERIDELYVAYTSFGSIISHEPTVAKLLPLVNGDAANKGMEVIYEPNLNVYLRKSVPVYLTMFLYGAMMESTVCEQAARMTSMDAAARNAGEIMEDLTLLYNRQRQSAITQEISEIVGGANAI